MTKEELRHTLMEQAEMPMTQAVMQKLEYLQSDDVFAIEPSEDKDDMSLEEAFAQSGINMKVAPIYEEPSVTEFEKQQQALGKPSHYLSEPATDETINQHKQSIAEKIAALRGISLPGDYLRNKNKW